MYTLVAVGADPEFFVQKDGEPFPICGQLGGTKKEPILLFNDGFSGYQEDNVMVEFNVMPSRSPEEFYNNTKKVMDHVFKLLADKGLSPVISPSELFKEEYLRIPQAQEIGCIGDVDAWTGERNPTLSADILKNVRTSGGHVHVSFLTEEGLPSIEDKETLVQALDLYLGVPSVLLDTDSRRRSFYGKPGAYRERSYGIEYRALSNFWIRTKKETEWVFQQVQRAITGLNRVSVSKLPLYWSKDDENMTRETISSGNQHMAKILMRKYGVEVPA